MSVEYQKKFVYNVYDVVFPNTTVMDSSHWRVLARRKPCTTERLFLHVSFLVSSAHKFCKHFGPKSSERSCSEHHENIKHGIFDIHHKYDLYAELRAFSHPTFTQLPTHNCYNNYLWYSSDTGSPIMYKLGQGGGVGEYGILLCEN